jgi:integrase
LDHADHQRCNAVEGKARRVWRAVRAARTAPAARPVAGPLSGTRRGLRCRVAVPRRVIGEPGGPAAERAVDQGLVAADRDIGAAIGTPRSADNVRRDFQAICEKADLGKEGSPRELRHSFVSMLSADGVATEDISHLVGHSSTRTTERVYRHELRPVLRTGAERMGRIFSQRS